MSETLGETTTEGTSYKETLEKFSKEELIRECQSLRKQNSLLNCRLLGVNELARLLQEKTEAVETLQDKNRRLELAVLRLENRCSNMDKRQKSQQFSSMPANVSSMPSSSGTANGGTSSSPKGGVVQSPFIPGPSKQILESLMKQNNELKKTIGGLTKKGPTSYREAVKLNHLEEVIEQKNETIELLRKQLDSITSASSKDEDGQADVGTLQKQLLKMEQSMKVKDRFCTLLSEQVNKMTKELSELKKGSEDFDGPDSKAKEHKVKEKNLKKMIEELQQQVQMERNEKKEAFTQADENLMKLNEAQNELSILQAKIDESNHEISTLLNEKVALTRQFEELKSSSNQSADIKDLKLKYQKEQEMKNAQIDQLRRYLEDAQYKYALAESKATNLQGLQDSIKTLEEDNETLRSDIAVQKRKVQDLLQQNNLIKQRYTGQSYNLGSTSYVTAMRSGGAPSIVHNPYMEDIVTTDSPTPNKSLHDMIQSTIRPEVPPINTLSRDVGTDSTTDTSVPVTTPTNTVLDTKPPPSNVGTTRTNYRGGTSVATPTSGVSHHAQMGFPPHNYQDPRSYQMSEPLSYQTHSNTTPPTNYHGSVSRSLGGANSVGMIPMQRSLSVSPVPYSVHTTVPSTQGPMITQSGHTIASHVLYTPQSSHPLQTGQSGYQTAQSGYQTAQSGYQTAQSGYQTAQSGYQGGNLYSQQFGQSGHYEGAYYTSTTGGYYIPAGVSPYLPTTNSQSGSTQGSGPLQRRNSPTHPNNTRYNNNPNQ